MKPLLYIILLFALSFEIEAQEKGAFVIVTIEKKTSSNLHPYATDYWIVSRDLWKEYADDAIVPIYIEGFSLTDYNECSQDGKLVLHNYTKDELFDFEPAYEKSQHHLLTLIKENSQEVQSISKKWKSKYKEKIKVSLTPVNGIFCFCPMVHVDGRSMLEYAKKIAMPISDFSYDPTFWSSQEFKEIRRFDYSELDFVSLQQSRK